MLEEATQATRAPRLVARTVDQDHRIAAAVGYPAETGDDQAVDGVGYVGHQLEDMSEAFDDHRLGDSAAAGGNDASGAAEGPSARDYSLVGRDARRAVEIGLARPSGTHTDVPRKQMKELMQRRDAPAIRDTAHLARRSGGERRGRGVFLGAHRGASRSSSSMACSTDRPPTRAGTNADTAPPSGRNG